MKIFFDTEFIEDGKAIDLISIGMVKENGDRYYAISSEFDETKASNWVKENVLNKLESDVPRKTRGEIAKEIMEFAGENPEFWAYYADYDWVALCQLYGRMIDLPKGWPMFCRDFIQLKDIYGDLWIKIKDGPRGHNALEDAINLKESYDITMEKLK